MAASSTSTPPDDLAGILAKAGSLAGIDCTHARLLRHFVTAVYVVDDVVARVDWIAGAPDRAARAQRITRWLNIQGFPAAEPRELAGSVALPVVVPDGGREIAVTFWRYYPQPDPPGPRDFGALGHLARTLHSVAAMPPGPLPVYQPLAGLRAVLESRTAREVLSAQMHRWLLGQVVALRAQYEALDCPLGTGLIHADLHSGNMLRDDSGAGVRWRLGDWDSVCLGPREVDLVPMVAARRFGVDPAGVTAFVDVYGYDVREWMGIDILVRIREFNSVTALIRHAGADVGAARELALRLDSLRDNDHSVRWHPR